VIEIQTPPGLFSVVGQAVPPVHETQLTRDRNPDLEFSIRGRRMNQIRSLACVLFIGGTAV